MQDAGSIHTYTTEDAEIIGRICYMESGTSLWQVPNGEGWQDETAPSPMPVYNLPAIVNSDKGTLIVTESEQDVDALSSIALLATCSRNTDNPLLVQRSVGRKVVMVHSAGSVRDVLADALSHVAESVRIVKLDGSVEDFIKAGADKQNIIDKCKGADIYVPASDSIKVRISGTDYTFNEWLESGGSESDFIDALDAEMAAPIESYYVEDWDNDEAPPVDSGAPFSCLGYTDGYYYFLPHKTLQVFAIGAGSMTSAAQLLSVAPLEWWEQFAPSKNGVDWQAAANRIIRQSEQIGIFDPGMIRGRGAWFDAGRSVLHLGNRLLVDRAIYSLHEIRSRFIYERKPPIESQELSNPLDNAQASKVLHITESMNWIRQADSLLLAGFCVLAPICGALTWRPHVWLTAQRGAGKSYAFDNIIAPLVGKTAVIVQGNSTEAGIRQKLRQDARPVIFDEAESESASARGRMQGVFDLARASSSDSDAEIAKGTTGGHAMAFRCRAMFILGSINVGLAQASDKSRFTVLALDKPARGPAGRKQFEVLEKLINETLSDQFCASLRSRTYCAIPTIRANAAVLAKAGAEHFGSQRIGDQIGALLAGAYSLKSMDKLSLEDARAWIASQDWTAERDDTEDSDEFQLLTHILHAQIRVDSTRGVKMRTVSELAEFLAGVVQDIDITADEANRALQRAGLRIKDGCLIVSDSHPELKLVLRDTAWGAGWSRVLERVSGAVKLKAARFAGVTHRAVSVPLEGVMG